MTLLIAVALCAGLFSVVRVVLNPPVPTTIVHGRVVFGHPIQGLVGRPALATVHAQLVSSLNEEDYGNGRIPRFATATTDSSGRYTMPELEAGTYNTWAVRPGYTVVALDSFLCDGTTTVPDLSLIRGGTITGRVIDADTGQPAKLEGGMATIGLHGPSRPKSGAAIESAPLQDDGTFFIRAAPGKNLVYIPWCGTNESSSAWVEVADGQTVEVELKVSTNAVK